MGLLRCLAGDILATKLTMRRLVASQHFAQVMMFVTVLREKA
jgi:hypothetical protein